MSRCIRVREADLVTDALINVDHIAMAVEKDGITTISVLTGKQVVEYRTREGLESIAKKILDAQR